MAPLRADNKTTCQFYEIQRVLTIVILLLFRDNCSLLEARESFKNHPMLMSQRRQVSGDREKASKANIELIFCHSFACRFFQGINPLLIRSNTRLDKGETASQCPKASLCRRWDLADVTRRSYVALVPRGIFVRGRSTTQKLDHDYATAASFLPISTASFGFNTVEKCCCNKIKKNEFFGIAASRHFE